jgi:hypothetical protein
MNVDQLAKSLFDTRSDFPKARGAPSFTAPTWDSVGEPVRASFREYASRLTNSE